MKRSRLKHSVNVVRKQRLNVPGWVTDEIAEVLANLDAIKMEVKNPNVDALAIGSEQRLEKVQNFLLGKRRKSDEVIVEI
jgi:hypothetical protein